MLLGSEEHYYVSLLYNWNRTQAFIQSLSSQVRCGLCPLMMTQELSPSGVYFRAMSRSILDVLSPALSHSTFPLAGPLTIAMTQTFMRYITL